MPNNPTSPERPLPGLRERKKARTKATVQREALRLFSQHGYAETSVEQIAAAAEISPSTFFRYFPTKEDVVLTDFIDSRVVEVFQSAPAELGPLAAFRHAVQSLGSEVSPADLELEGLRNDLIRQVPELRVGILRELMRPMQLMAGALAERLGRPADDLDVQVFAGAMIGGLIGSSLTGDGVPGRVEVSDVPGYVLSRLERLEKMLDFPGTD